jgi:hypothetical protein
MCCFSHCGKEPLQFFLRDTTKCWGYEPTAPTSKSTFTACLSGTVSESMQLYSQSRSQSPSVCNLCTSRYTSHTPSIFLCFKLCHCHLITVVGELIDKVISISFSGTVVHDRLSKVSGHTLDVTTLSWLQNLYMSSMYNTCVDLT